MKFFTRGKQRLFLLPVAGVLLPMALITGCGGGGGSSSGGGPVSPTSTPITNTPIAINRLVIQLRDDAGVAVDGIVTVDGIRRATLNGEVVFNDPTQGNKTATAEVGTLSASRTFAVGAGTTTIVITVSGTLSPGTPTTPPAPPFGG